MKKAHMEFQRWTSRGWVPCLCSCHLLGPLKRLENPEDREHSDRLNCPGNWHRWRRADGTTGEEG